jgi:predicted N-acetyltransferase YhbS
VSDRWQIDKLSTSHDRSAFDCGVPALDRYFARQAGQDVRRHLANCFVAVERATGTVAGFYTFSAAAIDLTTLPDAMTRRLPPYPALPAALIGRLAVDSRFHGQRLGGILIFDAVRRALSADPAIFGVVVQAKTEKAAAFYRHFQFVPLSDKPQSFFLPVGFFASMAP